MDGIEHKYAAESLLEQAQAEFERLREVPVEGITRFPDGHWEIGDSSNDTRLGIFTNQSHRRDELGKSIQGKYAMAQVHATLYLGDMQAEANIIQSLKR